MELRGTRAALTCGNKQPHPGRAFMASFHDSEAQGSALEIDAVTVIAPSPCKGRPSASDQRAAIACG
jgi:hypothetical protein